MQSSSTLNYDLSQINVKENDFSLPKKLEDSIFYMVKARNFEGLRQLYVQIQEEPFKSHINTSRVRDEIYHRACFSYTPAEFDQLNQVVPISLNELIGYSIFGIGSDSVRNKRPLLHEVAQQHNVLLFKHLLELGADKNKCDGNETSLAQLLESNEEEQKNILQSATPHPFFKKTAEKNMLCIQQMRECFSNQPQLYTIKEHLTAGKK